MARQVKVVDGTIRINETALAVLDEVFRRAEASNGVAVASLAELGEATGCSRRSARHVCRTLRERGLLTVMVRHAEDGGQEENAYVLTAEGLRILEDVRKGNGVLLDGSPFTLKK